ncbi:MAG: hypothetical protein HRT38_15475 [Alteromonadaceae bacterium]|nr:hypothetical protein [Alteromonadaceae bacterium]
MNITDVSMNINTRMGTAGTNSINIKTTIKEERLVETQILKNGSGSDMVSLSEEALLLLNKGIKAEKNYSAITIQTAGDGNGERPPGPCFP